jgi:hypothetical protein
MALSLEMLHQYCRVNPTFGFQILEDGDKRVLEGLQRNRLQVRTSWHQGMAGKIHTRAQDKLYIKK